MRDFFRCVAEAISAKGFRSLAAEVPLGGFLVDVAGDAWKRLADRRRQAGLRAEVEQLARAGIDDVKRAAAEAARHAVPDDPARSLDLELYLTQIPAAVRRSLRRASDPAGATVPAALPLDQPADLVRLLPARVSRFRPGDPLPGRDGWALGELLGVGGFGEVWLARHPQFQSLRRAVKFCPGLTDRDRALLHEGGMIDRVMRSGAVPGVVPLIDADLSGPTPWLMYEYVGGGDLSGLLTDWAGLPPADRHARAADALRQVTAAVAHFHRLRVVHRDLKPANILVRAGGGELAVADFGIGGVAAGRELDAGRRDTAGTDRLATVARGAYTPMYASPQQKRGLPPDPRDDVYALGVIGYQLLTADVTAERPGGRGWRRGLAADAVPAGLLDLLDRCWDDDPAERPQDAGELLDRLRQAGDHPRDPEPLPPDAPPQPQRKRKPPAPRVDVRRVAALAAGFAALLLALLLVAGRLARSPDRPPPPPVVETDRPRPPSGPDRKRPDGRYDVLIPGGLVGRWQSLPDPAGSREEWTFAGGSVTRRGADGEPDTGTFRMAVGVAVGGGAGPLLSVHWRRGGPQRYEATSPSAADRPDEITLVFTTEEGLQYSEKKTTAKTVLTLRRVPGRD